MRPHQPEEGDQGFFITDVAQDNALQEENESDQEQNQQQPEVQQTEPTKAEEEDDEFDFGKAKMDFFKKRAREILMNDTLMEYEGNPMPLAGAYKNLKHAVKNPSTVYTKLESKPGYMKGTFAQGRQAPAANKYLELGKQMDIAKSTKQFQTQLNPLLLSMKDKNRSVRGGTADKKDNKFLEAVFGAQKIQSKKEMERDQS